MRIFERWYFGLCWNLRLVIIELIIISWTILVSFIRGLFWRLIYFCMVKYLSFHNSSFALRSWYAALLVPSESSWRGCTNLVWDCLELHCGSYRLLNHFFQWQLNQIKTGKCNGILGVLESPWWVRINGVFFTIFRAKVWKILIFEWILLLEIQTNCKNWVCKEIGKLVGQKMMDEIDYFVPMSSRNSFGEEFLQYFMLLVLLETCNTHF
jgi:hypothetical protein